MGETLVNGLWRMVVGGLIAAAGLIGAGLCYQGLLSALTLRWQASVAPLAGGVALGVAVYVLCRHRNDLISS